MEQSLLTRQLAKMGCYYRYVHHILMYFSVAFLSFDGICHTGFNCLAEKQSGLLMLACKVALVLFLFAFMHLDGWKTPM